MDGWMDRQIEWVSMGWQLNFPFSPSFLFFCLRMGMKGGPPIGKGSPAWFCFDFCLELGADGFYEVFWFHARYGAWGKRRSTRSRTRTWRPGKDGMGWFWSFLHVLKTFCNKLVPNFRVFRGEENLPHVCQCKTLRKVLCHLLRSRRTERRSFVLGS